jgi:hypothetical protein
MSSRRKSSKAKRGVSVMTAREMLPCLRTSPNGPFETVRSHAPRIIAEIVAEAQTAEAEDQLLNKVALLPTFKCPTRTNKIYFLGADSDSDWWVRAAVSRRGN